MLDGDISYGGRYCVYVRVRARTLHKCGVWEGGTPAVAHQVPPHVIEHEIGARSEGEEFAR